jgi:alkylhydroperoxidase family enzyme
MARVTYWNAGDAEAEEVATQVRKRRGGRLLNIDRILLHSPPATRGWGALLGALRGEFTLSAFHRELLVCAVASLTDAAYELAHHTPILIGAGATAAQVKALEDVARAMGDVSIFDDASRALLHFAFESTCNVQVEDACWRRLEAAFPDERALVEIVLVVAAYNMVSRVAGAVGLELEEQGA